MVARGIQRWYQAVSASRLVDVVEQSCGFDQLDVYVEPLGGGALGQKGGHFRDDRRVPDQFFRRLELEQ
jgi:hypothetical protein